MLGSYGIFDDDVLVRLVCFVLRLDLGVFSRFDSGLGKIDSWFCRRRVLKI